MAVDKGGLRYTIQVEDKFSAGLKKFRSEIAAIRKELRASAEAQSALNAARRQGGVSAADRAQLQNIRRIQAAIRQQAIDEKRRASILRQQRADQSAAARLEIDQFRRQKAAEAKAAAARISATRRQAAEQAKANRQTAGGARALDRVNRSARRAEGGINRVAFTFRRMVGIFAAFQAARVGADLFRSSIAQGVQFNQTIEDSTISLAALFSAAGRVTDETGKQLQGAEAFARAQGEARRQTNLLRQDALGTTATFQELLRAFQAGVGPGLEAGLQLDQIREVTVRVSQAAAALTVPQNQLIEEIRSLLRGTIQARTTIVASVLGITNEDIKKAKEAGNLFNFLRERLGPFAEAAEATRGSFTGLIARINDATAAVAGEAASTLFVTLKDALLDLFTTLITFDEETGAFIANAEAVGAIKPLFDALAQTILDLKKSAEGLNLANLTVATTAIGEALRVLVSIGTGVLKGIVDGLADIAGLFGLIGEKADGLQLETITELLRVVTRIATVMLGLNITLGLTRTLFNGLISPVLAVSRGISSLATSAAALAGTTKGALLASFGLVLVSVVAVGAALKAAIDDFAGFSVKAGTVLRIISEGFQNLITIVGASLNVSFTAITQGVVQLFSELASALLGRLANLVGNVADSLGDLLPATAAQLASAEASFRSAAVGFGKSGAEAAGKIEAATIKLGQAQQKFLDDLQLAIDEDAGAASAGELGDAFVQSLTSSITEGLDALFPDLFGGDAAAENAGASGEKQAKTFVNGVNKGLTDADKSGLEKFFEGIVTNFESGLSLVRPLVQQLSSFISDSIVDAFDPTNDTDLLERFARFLQSIAKLIIQQLVQIAIAKAVLGLIGGPAAGPTVAATGVLGRAEGGDIPDGKAAPRMLRPKGLDARDTTPIWAQPGEFMVKKSVVDQPAVREFLKALNSGLIAPSALKGLVGSGNSHRHISGFSGRGPQGYVEGGIIQQVGADVAASSNASSQSGQGGDVNAAILVANDTTAERMLAGGRKAVLDFLDDNASDIEASLARFRS